MSSFSGVMVEVLLLESKKKDNAIDLKVTDTYREQTCGCQGGGCWEGMDWECGFSRCSLLHIEWMENKVVLYSTGNYIHCPGINHSGKEYLKKYLSIYLYTHTHVYI